MNVNPNNPTPQEVDDFLKSDADFFDALKVAADANGEPRDAGLPGPEGAYVGLAEDREGKNFTTLGYITEDETEEDGVKLIPEHTVH